MTEVFVGWGDGTLKHNGKKITQFATEDLRIIPQYTKSKTSRIFFFITSCISYQIKEK